MAKLRMFEIGRDVMGRGIAFAFPCGNHIKPFWRGFFTPS
jgi:hypothetical protein